MKNSRRWFTVHVSLLMVAVLGLAGVLQATAQEVSVAPETAEDAEQPVSDRVTINVTNGNISDVLEAFSRQTGRSIVIGPDITNSVSLRLNDTPWDEALDVMLRPYGYDYRQVGDAIVINSATNLTQYEEMVTDVFTLKYISATDVVAIVQGQLTSNAFQKGSVKILPAQREAGWQFQAAQGSGSQMRGGAGIGEKRERVADAGKKEQSKTLIVTDLPEVLEEVRAMLTELDLKPTQILIEARFVEVKSNYLRDIGLEWGTGADGATADGVLSQAHAAGSDVFGIGAQQTGGGVQPAAFSAASGSTLNDRGPFNAGMTLQFQQLTGVQFDLLLHMLQEDDSANILSSPRVLTVNNQEATIKVGTKFPIIRSEVSGEGTATISTYLEYYEDIGIQLNVVPQVCGENQVSLVVHPAVTEQIGTEGGIVVSIGAQEVPLTRYPVLSVREAETRIISESGSTVVIGGLLQTREAKTELKVPFLGSLPLLGWMFRRDTTDNQKVDLLIFLTATIMPSDAEMRDLAAERKQQQRARAETQMMIQAAAAAEADTERAVLAERTAREKMEEQLDREVEAREAAEEKMEAIRAEKEELREEREEEIERRKSAEKDARAARAEKVAAEKKALAAAEARAAEATAARAKALREDQKARRMAEKARMEAEKKAKSESEAKAEAEEAARRKAEKDRITAEKNAKDAARAKTLAELRTKQETERLQKIEAERQARVAAEAEKARLKEEAQAKKEAAEREDAERIAREKAAHETEEAQIAAERKAKDVAEAQERQRLAAEKRAKADAEKKAIADLRAKQETELAQRKAQEQAKADAEALADAQRDALRLADRERVVTETAAMEAEETARKLEAKHQAKAAREAEKARIAAERKAREQEEQAKLLEEKKAMAAKKLAEEQRKFAERRAQMEANAQATNGAAEEEATDLIRKLPAMSTE